MNEYRSETNRRRPRRNTGKRAGAAGMIAGAAAVLTAILLLGGCGTAAKSEPPGENAGSTAAESAGSTAAESAGSAAAESEDTAAAENIEGTEMAETQSRSLPAEEDLSGEQEEASESAVRQAGFNGGYFALAGDKVYFRKYLPRALEGVALWGQYLESGLVGGRSVMMSYDPASGEVTEEFEDIGYGKLFPGDGGFYCKRAGEDFGSVAYWVSLDGKHSRPIGQGEPLGITQQGDEAAFLTLRDQDPDRAGDLFILREAEETARAVRKGSESLEYCGMYGEYAIYMACDNDAGTNFLYSLSGLDGSSVCLGEMPVVKEDFYYPYLEAEQFLADEEGVYLVASNYAGTGHFRNYSLAVRAVPGVENSLRPIETNAAEDGGEEQEEEEQDGAEPQRPILFLSGPGEVSVVPGSAGTAGLSEGDHGDLVYYDSPFSALQLIPGFVKESEWDAQERSFLQTAEVIGDAVYVIKAFVSRDEEDDIGWRMAYKLEELSWLAVPFGEGMLDSSGNAAETDLIAQEYYGNTD